MMAGGNRTHASFKMAAGNPTQSTIEILAPREMKEETLRQLVDFIPGMVNFSFDKFSCIATVRYENPASAMFAKDKIAGFEPAPGQRLGARIVPRIAESTLPRASSTGPLLGSRPGSHLVPEINEFRDTRSMGIGMAEQYQGGVFGAGNNSSPQPTQNYVQDLVQTLKKATETLAAVAGGGAASNNQIGGWQQSGNFNQFGGPDQFRGRDQFGGFNQFRGQDQLSFNRGDSDFTPYTDIPLPKIQQILDSSSPVEESLFITSVPTSFSKDVLTDLFCRFGNLVSAFFLPGNNNNS